MTWGSQSWDSLDDDFGGKKNNGSNETRTFYLPAQVTKRVLFLTDAPYTFYQHSLYELTGSGKDKEICLKKNRIAQECPLCDNEMWPSLIGFFTVIDMGDVKRGSDGQITLEGWTSDRGVTYQFDKKLLGAKRGGRDKPGILRKLGRLAEKHQGLVGCVFDVYRSGGKTETCGDEWEFVEKISPEQYADYLRASGADDDQIPDFEQVNYTEHFVPKTVEELSRMVNGGGSFGGNSFGGNSGNSFGGNSSGNAQGGGSNSWKKWG
jgi:hypothetical protein